MKPIKIALICKNENSKRRDNRAMGYFSYAVPEFTWEHFTPGKNFNIDLDDLKADGYDLVFHEDYPYGSYIGDSIPVIFLAIDSTLSHEHYEVRRKQSLSADLTLVDHDNPKRFKDAIQFPYCVNDKIFYKDERQRNVDIVFHCSSSAHTGNEERKRIRQLLHEFTKKHGWVYKSGILDLPDYANSFRSAKIVINQSRTPLNRPHRIFDAMACGAMVLTNKIPYLESDIIRPYFEYEYFENDEMLEQTLNSLLWTPKFSGGYFYESIANDGYNVIMQNHTWSIRAKQLREIINKEFNL